MSGKDSRYHYAYGTRRDTAILHWMYSGADLVLERKRERFLTSWFADPECRVSEPSHRQAGLHPQEPGALGC